VTSLAEGREHPFPVLAPSGVTELIAGLRAERERQGLTQAQLAEKAGYCRNAIYFLESGRRGTRLETIADCAQTLGLRFALLPADADVTITRHVVCAPCGRLRRPYGRGWCRACFRRWARAGRPASGPPPSRSGRWEEYEELTREMGHTPRQAAERMGITDRTARRYETRIANALNGQDDD
jgi:DNA-binding XRE family transcriptional regulator